MKPEKMLSGGRVAEGVTQFQAEQILEKEGIRWGRIVVDVYKERDYWSGNVKEREDPIRYFMYNDTDVAYYIPAMNTLHIHDTPRAWSPEFLAGVRTVEYHPSMRV